jgi:hypothetical protein
VAGRGEVLFGYSCALYHHSFDAACATCSALLGFAGRLAASPSPTCTTRPRRWPRYEWGPTWSAHPASCHAPCAGAVRVTAHLRRGAALATAGVQGGVHARVLRVQQGPEAHVPRAMGRHAAQADAAADPHLRGHQEGKTPRAHCLAPAGTLLGFPTVRGSSPSSSIFLLCRPWTPRWPAVPSPTRSAPPSAATSRWGPLLSCGAPWRAGDFQRARRTSFACARGHARIRGRRCRHAAARLPPLQWHPGIEPSWMGAQLVK